ncbi:AAA family ATPase [Desulfopila aestuarii]|uniref:AAA domain-containing protein n=1 Tax=Desulfopila aestuarii DSM 18488 TaxID=1121416 RepID=A0A1M7Y2M1_9BACT|nr:AAA family ATPase [Desulfopila aestuarii]SHO46201.1 hypothetical protein SAMN02745220_01356 [Desulfopila aestuarii DSM 18488]
MKAMQQKRILVFFGMTGSGKSYLSTAWAQNHGCQRLNTDVVRKEYIIKTNSRQLTEKGIDKGIYTPELTRRTYEQLLDLTEKALADPSSSCVVLDGSFQRASDRRQLVERFHGRASMFFIFCHCNEHVTRSRLGIRRADPMSVSDGDLDVYLHQLTKFENPTEIQHRMLLELDTDASLEYLIDRLDCFLARTGAEHSGSTRLDETK